MAPQAAFDEASKKAAGGRATLSGNADVTVVNGKTKWDRNC